MQAGHTRFRAHVCLETQAGPAFLDNTALASSANAFQLAGRPSPGYVSSSALRRLCRSLPMLNLTNAPRHRLCVRERTWPGQAPGTSRTVDSDR